MRYFGQYELANTNVGQLQMLHDELLSGYLVGRQSVGYLLSAV